MAQPIRDKVFISYSHKDQEWLARLQTMIRPFIRAGEVQVWDDTQVRTGTQWREQIHQALATAKVGVMLVSPNFLASDFIAEVELPSLLAAAVEEGLQVCWILTSAYLYETARLSEFQAAHDISRPLDGLSPADLNATLADIAREIKRLAETQPPPPPPPPPERRQVTVLVCNLGESHVLAERLDLEEVDEVIRAYEAASAEVIHQYEGHMEQYLGDGLLVYFGYPLVHEDDTARAVRAGLKIVDRMTRLNDSLLQGRGISLAMRLGMHTGMVVAGDMRAGDMREPPIRGELPNLAAQLQEIAEPNALVIRSATYQLVRRRFHCQALGAHSLRGRSQPVVAYRVIEEREDQHAPTPLVGREQEVGLLLERWAQVQEGMGQVVVLSGEAGIGKSRLVQEVIARIPGQPHTRLECQCSPYAQHSALYPIIDLLQRQLRWERDDSADAKLGKLEGALAGYHLSLPGLVPLLASLLSLPLPERYPPPLLSPQRQRQKTLEALLAVLLTLSSHEPVLLVVEDLHWADPSTLELLGLFIDQSPTMRLLMLLTSRPEFRPSWGYRAHVTPVTLGRLLRTQAEVMIERVTGRKALPPEVRQQVVVKTDGVPLFVEELTKMVLESSLLQEREDHYELAGPLPLLSIPATLRDSLMARLDRLAEVKEVAQLAATLGREFPYELLRAVSPLDEVTLQRGLSRLVEVELFYRVGLPPHVKYLFKHALIQEAAYESLLKRTRQQYHQRIAETLAERFPETAEIQPELLAYHFTEAGLNGPAIGFWRQAVQRAIERSAYVEAIGHLSKALGLLEFLPETADRTQLELTLELAKSVPLIATRGYGVPEVGQAYTRARELCRQVGETTQLFPVLRGLSAFYIARAELQTAHELAEQLCRLAQHGRDAAMLVEAHQMLGTTLFCRGEIISARVHLEQGIALYDPQQHRIHTSLYGGADPGVVCLIYAIPSLWLLGHPDQALTRSQEALTLAEELSHPFSLAYALNMAAVLHQLRHERQAAQERAEAAIRLSTEQGFPLWLAMGMILRGVTLVERGQETGGIVQIRQGLSIFQSTGVEMGRPHFLALLAEGYGREGQAGEGLIVLVEALAAAQNTGERWWEAELYRLQGELKQAHSPESDAQAEASLLQAYDVACSQQAKSLELRAVMSLSRLWERRGQRARGQELLGEVYGWFTEGFDTRDLQEAKALLQQLS